MGNPYHILDVLNHVWIAGISGEFLTNGAASSLVRNKPTARTRKIPPVFTWSSGQWSRDASTAVDVASSLPQLSSSLPSRVSVSLPRAP